MRSGGTTPLSAMPSVEKVREIMREEDRLLARSVNGNNGRESDHTTRIRRRGSILIRPLLPSLSELPIHHEIEFDHSRNGTT